MNRNEQLEFCKNCLNRKFDFNKGLICNITDNIADFDIECPTFEKDEDAEIKNRIEEAKYYNEKFGKIAGSGKRLANYLLDLVFMYAFVFLFSASLGIILAIFKPSALSYFTEDNKIASYIVTFFVGMLYYSTFEALTARTIAKYITKTKVITLDGKQPGYATILLRTFFRFIPFEAFSFLGSDNSGWHDKISNTIVVEINKPQVMSEIQI